MSSSKHRLETAGTVRKNGYDWTLVNCKECSETVRRTDIYDEGEYGDDDYREDVCPVCDESMEFESILDNLDVIPDRYQ